MSTICGPFQLGTWDSTKKVYKNGHNVNISGDRKSLEIYATDEIGASTTKVCDCSLVSSNFVCLLVDDNAIKVEQAKLGKSVSISISNSKKGMSTRLHEAGGTGITSFIGTDDVRQWLYIFYAALEVVSFSGVNLRYDESSQNLIIEY